VFVTPIDRAPFVLDVDETEWFTMDSAVRRHAHLRVTEIRLFVTPVDRTSFALDVDVPEWFTVGRAMRPFSRFGIAEIRTCITSVDDAIDWHTPFTQVHSFL
jgi:hypothetical protein